jgi:hypothetical protein
LRITVPSRDTVTVVKIAGTLMGNSRDFRGIPGNSSI